MPRKETHADAANLKSLRQYLATPSACDVCGTPITASEIDGDPHVVVLAIEWRDDTPALLARQAVCDLCAADMPEFTLPNALRRRRAYVAVVPPDVRRQETDEIEQASRRAVQTLASARARLESALTAAQTPEARAKIMAEIDALVTEATGIDADADGLGAMRDPWSDSNDIASASARPTRNDQRIDLQKFLQSPYQNALKPVLRRTAHMYATGWSEAKIAKELKLNQSTVSRQIREILHVARQRR